MKQKKTSKKVAHIIGSLKIGGAERFIIDLSIAQKKLNIQPAIISLGSPTDDLVGTCHINNIPVASYSSHSYIKLCRVFMVLLKFDVIHVHSPHALKYLSLFLPLLRKTVVYTRHGAAPYSSAPWLRFHQKIKQYIAAVTFVSQEGKDNFHQAHEWGNVTSVVVDNGVLIEPVNKVPAKSEVLRIGSVGRVIPLKNQIGLLKAIQRLPADLQTNVEIHFFGDGLSLEDLKTFYKEKTPTLAVTFHGMVNDRELIYSSLDLLVVTSETEGLSMVIIEAMANSIPVVATNVGGNPRLVKHDETGWLFEFDDDQKLAEQILNIMNNRSLVDEIGTNALAYITDNFSIESSAKKYAELYEK
ncbi:glycosyltransferase family 4 protein [Colwellia sp. MB02u-9]|uniref:glycosyltransferase family 4 protein n=1 Tax=Colwellia sp. MB02u-9 TaxID=2759823 RepID=UPI0015F5EBAA|nr:glycosyltransferase family 4 protein [Colwellia sp. MB02u-9]MBA6295157.1 glycosyltransferase family 4 protein [Colwellia sp. MB02u-9]